MLNDFYNDGVVYLELRTTPRDVPGLGKEGYVHTVLECIKSFEGKGRMSTYLILSIDRRNSPEQAMEVVDLAVKYRERGVVGVDLCGDPAKADVATFKDAFAKARGVGLGITLHFAEVKASEEELRMMLDMKPQRLGHVCKPGGDIRQEILENGIGVELCVSCNVLAGLTDGGMDGHHFKWWWENAGNIVLCVSNS